MGGRRAGGHTIITKGREVDERKRLAGIVRVPCGSTQTKLQVMDESDDEEVDYKGHFCAECSIPPP